jgi:hypothetical protein
MTDAWRRWRALFSGRSDARPLGLFRIAWSVAAFTVLVLDATRAGEFGERFTVPWFEGIEPVSTELFELVRWGGMLGSIAVGLGVAHRLGAATVVLGQGYLLLADLLLFRNHVYLLCLLGLVLAASPTPGAYSLTALRSARRTETSAKSVPRWIAQTIKGQVLVVYGWAAINKLNAAFLSGWVLEGELATAFAKSPLAALALELGGYEALSAWFGRPGALSPLAWFVVLAELTLVIGLAAPRWRRPAVFVGLCLHGGIFLTMSVFSFGLLLVGTYPMFVWGMKARRPAPLHEAPLLDNA